MFNNRHAFYVITMLFVVTNVMAQNLTFSNALEIMLKSNKAISSSKSEITKSEYELKASRGLYFPQLSINANYTRINDDISIDLNEIRTAMLFLHADNPLANMLPSFEKGVQDKEFFKANATITWPIFTGGKISAANSAAKARLKGVKEKANNIKEKLITELVTRYFGLQLSYNIVEIRKSVFEAMEKHLDEAQKFEKEGMIAKSELLHAKVFHAEAEREYKNSLRNLEIIKEVFKNTIATSEKYNLSTELFITKEIEPLSYFLQSVNRNNSILKQIESKHILANQGVNKEFSEFLPQVYLFGKKELYTNDLTLLEPTWAIGVGLKINLFEGLAKVNRLKAAKYTVKQITDFKSKTKNDLETLTNKRYNELMNAKEQYSSTDAALIFAKEYVYVRTRAFEEGLAKSIDVVDAQLALSRVKIERLTALYNFDISLAKLLEVSGMNNKYISYLNRNDVEVESVK